MAKITFAPFGSLGDLHPLLALAIEMRERGHEIKIATLEVYRERIEILGFPFFAVRPDANPEDREMARKAMDLKGGSEFVIRDLMLGNIRDSYKDLMKACEGSEILVSGEIFFASFLVAEKLNLKHITTTLAPISMFSTYESSYYPNAPFLYSLDFLGRPYRSFIKSLMSRVLNSWFRDYKDFRKEIGLNPDHNPLFDDKFSSLLHLVLFSKVLGNPQPDWDPKAVQTGFCFYDGHEDLGGIAQDIQEFLDAGEPPIVFTLGSAAVMDPGVFYEESIKAAKLLDRRAVLLYGLFNEKPTGLDYKRIGVDYAPYSQLFPNAACVVHQGGVGTTAQVLKAGVPHLFMPYSHDQPDNAVRCRKIGVAEIVERNKYNAQSAAQALRKILSETSYKAKAIEAKRIVDGEGGTNKACDEIERFC